MKISYGLKEKTSRSTYTKNNLDKGNFNHFMQKEIFEQPHIIGDSLSRFLDPIKKTITIPDLKVDWKTFPKFI